MQRLRAGEAAGLVARSLEVSRQELYRWSRDVDKFGERAFPGVGQKRAEETRIAELERKIGQQVLECPTSAEVGHFHHQAFCMEPGGTRRTLLS